MKVAFLSDTHADERKKWDEHCRVMDWIATDIAKRGVDLVAHGGDIFEGASTPTERTYVADWIRRITETAPFVVVAGNHDRALDVEYMARLRTTHPVVAVERPGVHVVAGVAVACLPWPRAANLLAMLGRDVGHEEANQVAVAALQTILLGMRDEVASHAGPVVLLAHAMVEGAKTDSRQPLVGMDMSLSLADLGSVGAQIMVAGHVHAEQQMRFGGVDLVIPGCPYHRTFGEPGPTSYVVAEFDAARSGYACFGWERIATPATPMLRLEAEWDAEHGILIGPHRLTDIAGAEIRLRYDVTTDQRGAAKARAEEYRVDALARGAVVVKIEEVVSVVSRTRAPEVAEAKTLGAKLDALWKMKGVEMSQARRERVGAKLLELESEE